MLLTLLILFILELHIKILAIKDLINFYLIKNVDFSKFCVSECIVFFYAPKHFCKKLYNSALPGIFLVGIIPIPPLI